MRNLFYSCVALLLVAACGSGDTDTKKVVLEFNVTDKTSDEVVMIVHNDVKTFALDQNGCAEAVLTGFDAAYARLFYGREFKWVYLENGDKATISFSGKDFARTFSFVGEKAPAVGYLNMVKLTALPDEDYALPFEEYLSKIEDKEQDALKLMKANDLRSAGRFEKMEEGRIRYSYATPLLMHPVGHMMMTGNMEYKPDESYYKVIDSYLVDDPMWVDLDEYRAFAVEAAHMLDDDNRDVTSLYPKAVAQLRFIADRFSNDKVRSTLLHYLASAYVDSFGIDDIQDLENIYRTYVKDEDLLKDFQAKYDKWDRSTPGKPSPALTAVDIDGKTWTLDDFKGKYVYIDMWATWCAPCKREMPYLKELEAKFSDAEIVFLGLSIDGNKAQWEEMVRSGSLTGVQLYVGPRSEFQKAYNIDGIPRFILLDKEGVIISNDMSRPSAPETQKSLDALEGIR